VARRIPLTRTPRRLPHPGLLRAQNVVALHSGLAHTRDFELRHLNTQPQWPQWQNRPFCNKCRRLLSAYPHKNHQKSPSENPTLIVKVTAGLSTPGLNVSSSCHGAFGLQPSKVFQATAICSCPVKRYDLDSVFGKK